MPDNVSVNKKLLREMTTKWSKRIEDALRNVDNVRRRNANIPPRNSESPVWIPTGPNAEMFLLTLRVWCIRYCVSPEFVIEILTRAYRRARRYDIKDRDLHLGLPAGMLASASARRIVEEEVTRVYPNEENRKSKIQPIPRDIDVVFDIDRPEASTRQYKNKIETARNAFDSALRRNRIRFFSTRRNFRKEK